METVNFVGAKRNQTIPAITFTMTIDTVPATVTKAEMDLRWDGHRFKRYSSETGEITISGNTITILSHTLTIPAHPYNYDVRLTLDTHNTIYPFGGVFLLDDAETAIQ